VDRIETIESQRSVPSHPYARNLKLVLTWAFTLDKKRNMQADDAEEMLDVHTVLYKD
jgi:hypothetical protein